MEAFESVKQCGSDILFSLHDFDPPISPVEHRRSVSGLDGGKIIEHVLGSARIRNAVTEVFLGCRGVNIPFESPPLAYLYISLQSVR